MFAQTRTQRSNRTDYGDRAARPAYGRGHTPGFTRTDEFGYAPEFTFAPPIVYTHQDATVKRFTEAQVYAQAGMVVKTLAGLRPTASVFPAGTYDGFSTEPTYTLKEMSETVARLVAGADIWGMRSRNNA